MPRIARVVVPGIPHHITQRGNRRQTTFFGDEDYRFYREVLGDWCSRCAVEIWAYCLMPNHVHLIAVPDTEHGFRASIGEAHNSGRLERPFVAGEIFLLSPG
jgi:putative transposase